VRSFVPVTGVDLDDLGAEVASIRPRFARDVVADSSTRTPASGRLSVMFNVISSGHENRAHRAG